MENKFNVREVSEELKQYNDLLNLLPGLQGKYHGKLDKDQEKAVIFGLMKLIKNIHLQAFCA